MPTPAGIQTTSSGRWSFGLKDWRCNVNGTSKNEKHWRNPLSRLPIVIHSQSISVSGAVFREMYYSFTFFGIVRSSFPTWKWTWHFMPTTHYPLYLQFKHGCAHFVPPATEWHITHSRQARGYIEGTLRWAESAEALNSNLSNTNLRLEMCSSSHENHYTFWHNMTQRHGSC